MDKKLTRAELSIIRTKCDEDLLFFTRFFFKTLHGTKFIVNQHHQEIVRQLKRVENYELDLLNINIPPRFSKTELAAVNLIARGIGMNPNSNWLYITASDELRSQTSVSIRDIVSHPYFKVMYNVELKKDQNAKNLWRTTQGGGLKTATIFGQITGFGAGQMIDNSDLLNHVRTFEGCIVLDDINKTDDSEVENANNEKVSRTLFNTIMSRKNSKDTPLINIQQRAGMSDATEQLKEHYKEKNDRAEFMVMPVIKDGVPLWEWKMGVKEIEETRTSPKTSHVFDTQYMQNPTRREGLCFDVNELNKYDHTKLSIDSDEVDAKVIFIDTADKGDDSLCAPAGVVINQKIYIHEVVYTTDEVKISNPQVANLINEFKPEWVRVESNMGGSMYVEMLRPMVNDFTTLLGVSAKGNKHTRIMAMSAFVKKYCYFRNDYEEHSEYGKFMKNLTSYKKDGKSKHDDAPDGLVGLCVMIKRFYPHLYSDAIATEDDGYGKD